MKTSTKNSIRQKIIFLMMIVSIIGFLIDYSLNFKRQVEPAIPKELDVNSLLIDTVGFSVRNPKYDRIYDEDMPSEILLYLEGYTANIQTNKEIVIFEILDKVEIQDKITGLIAEGDILFKEDKLTSPIGSNAFERYESALLIEENNELAIAGIQKIVNRYLSLADLVIKKNETYKVAGLIENAYKVSSDYFDISSQIKKYSAYIKDESFFLGQNDNAMIPVNKSLRDDDDNISTNSNEFSKANIKDVDRKTAYIAKNLVDHKHIYGAIKVLESFSSLSDYWGDSNNLLLSLYLKAAMDKEAESLVYKNKSLDLFQFAEKAAHIFVARDDVAGALHLLEGHKPIIDDYQDYYSLKAGLYYETGNYNGSSILYRKLLHVDYTNPIYWLGLAVSLDKLEDIKASQAYHYADYYSDNKSDVKHYIKKNIILVSIY